MVSRVSVFRLSFSCFFWLFVVGFRLHTQEKKYVFFLLVFLVCFCLSRREFCVSQNVYLEILKVFYGFSGFCVLFVFLLLFFVVSRWFFVYTHKRKNSCFFFFFFLVCFFLSRREFCVSQNVYLEILKVFYGF